MTYSTGKLPNVACATFFKGIADWNADGLLAGFTQSKQWRIKFFYRYKRAKTSRITVLNIRKLYLYFVYFKLCAILVELASSFEKWCVRNICMETRLFTKQFTENSLMGINRTSNFLVVGENYTDSEGDTYAAAWVHGQGFNSHQGPRHFWKSVGMAH